MAYHSLPTRKKQQQAKGKTIRLDESPIYSTLSKKPADLETSDIDLSAIRIFLGDGSHRTLSSTPTTTCGDILNRLLEKLGLLEQRNNYGLQIHYKFSEPRIPDDHEQLSGLNIHVYDSVDKIYLYKKSDTFVMMPLRKRVVSYKKHDSGIQEENIYENCAVSLGYRGESGYDASHLQPVLVNDKLACKFAKAWTTSMNSKTTQDKVVPIETPPQLIATQDQDWAGSATLNSTYTLDRKNKKMNTLKRQKPITSNKPNFSSQLSLNATITGISPANTQGCQHYKLPITSQGLSVVSQSFTHVSTDTRPNSGSYSEIGPLIPNPLHKSVSEGCLLSACESEDRKLLKFSSIETLHDSGFHDCSRDPPLPAHGKIRRKSILLDDISKASSLSTSVPSLALHSTRAHLKSGSIDSTDNVILNSSVNASTLKSYKSMELLSEDDFKIIEENFTSIKTQPLHQAALDIDRPPPIPKRMSSFLDNCSVSDDYLLKQGKRLSQVLNINAIIKSEQKGHIRSFFEKVGTLLTKRKRNELSTIPLESPKSSRPTMASQLDPPIDRPFPYDTNTPSSPKSPEQSDSSSSDYDIAISQPYVPPKNPVPKYLQLLSSDSDNIYENNETDDIDFYDTPSPQSHLHSSYDERDTQNNTFIQRGPNGAINPNGSLLHIHKVPPQHSVMHGIIDESNERILYENNSIQRGDNGAITFNDRKLHDYQTPPSRLYKSISPPQLPSQRKLTEIQKCTTFGTLAPRHDSNASIYGYKELITDWVQASSLEDIYDSVADNGDDYQSDFALRKVQSEPDLIYDIPRECDSDSEDEYMPMQPSVYIKQGSQGSRLLWRRNISGFQKSKSDSRVKASHANLLQSNSTQQSKPSHNRGNHNPSLFGPSSTLGAPPCFVPTAPKPTFYKLKHTATNSTLTHTETTPEDIPPPLPSIDTIPQGGLLQFCKDSPTRILSHFTTRPFLAPPNGFKAHPSTSTPPIQILPYSIATIPPMVVTPFNPEKKEQKPAVTPNGTLLIPPPSLPLSPPTKTKLLPQPTPKNQIKHLPGSNVVGSNSNSPTKPVLKSPSTLNVDASVPSKLTSMQASTNPQPFPYTMRSVVPVSTGEQLPSVKLPPADNRSKIEPSLSAKAKVPPPPPLKPVNMVQTHGSFEQQSAPVFHQSIITSAASHKTKPLPPSPSKATLSSTSLKALTPSSPVKSTPLQSTLYLPPSQLPPPPPPPPPPPQATPPQIPPPPPTTKLPLSSKPTRQAFHSLSPKVDLSSLRTVSASKVSSQTSLLPKAKSFDSTLDFNSELSAKLKSKGRIE